MCECVCVCVRACKCVCVQFESLFGTPGELVLVRVVYRQLVRIGIITFWNSGSRWRSWRCIEMPSNWSGTEVASCCEMPARSGRISATRAESSAASELCMCACAPRVPSKVFQKRESEVRTNGRRVVMYLGTVNRCSVAKSRRNRFWKVPWL